METVGYKATSTRDPSAHFDTYVIVLDPRAWSGTAQGLQKYYIDADFDIVVEKHLEHNKPLLLQFAHDGLIALPTHRIQYIGRN